MRRSAHIGRAETVHQIPNAALTSVEGLTSVDERSILQNVFLDYGYMIEGFQ